MDKFIHRQNFSLFSRRLAEPSLTDAQRKVILTLLTEEQVEGRQERAFNVEATVASCRYSHLDHSWVMRC
jgi:hypothetical protein